MTAAALFSESDRERAELLIAEIRAGFVNIERKTIELIEMRGWVALGYRTFEQMWNDRLRGVRIATDAMKAHVVYALLDSTDTEGVIAATGVGVRAAAALARQKSEGVPIELATPQGDKPTTVVQHRRKLPSPPRKIHLEVSAAEHAEWAQLANDRGVSLSSLCLSVLREHFDQ